MAAQWRRNPGAQKLTHDGCSGKPQNVQRRAFPGGPARIIGVVREVDPGTRIEGRVEQDGSKRSPLKPARTLEAGHDREHNGRSPGKYAECVVARAAQEIQNISRPVGRR